MVDPPRGRVIRRTRSPCPECRKWVPAEILLKDSSLYMVRKCPDHGECELLYRKDFSFYESISSMVHCVDKGREPDGARFETGAPISIVYVDLTDKCNLRCPVCLADTGGPSKEEITRESILQRLSCWEGRKPTVYLSGGEPTLRPDLPEIVSGIVRLGFIPVLITNGLKLCDGDYVRILREAGLKFIVLQFDGLTDDVHEKLRGRKLMDVKMGALENLARYGIMTSICMMVARGINDHQVGDIIRFGVQSRAIFEVELMPAVRMGRVEEAMVDPELESDEIMQLIQAQTEGRIRQSDFVASMKFLHWMYKATRIVRFRRKFCMLNCPVIGGADDFRPAIWYINPLNLVRKPRSLAQVGFVARNLLSLETQAYPGGLTLITIATLFSLRNLTADDLSICNLAYMTRDGYLPGCLYWLIESRGCMG